MLGTNKSCEILP